MTNPRVAQLRDATTLRAVAHPTRLRLLGLLRSDGAQTGAMLATQVGEAAGTVSYHLRTLEAAGLVAKAEPQSDDRRAQWWEAAHERTSWDTAALTSSADTADAAVALNHLIGQIYAQQWTAYVDALPTLPREWVDTGFSSDSALRLTSTQLGELGAELTAIAQRWQQVSDAQSAPDAEMTVLVTQAYRRIT